MNYDILRKTRKAFGLSLRQVADAAGIPYSHLSLIERGKKNAEVGTLERVCAVLGLAVTIEKK